MRFSELNARSGEPRCITESKKTNAHQQPDKKHIAHQPPPGFPLVPQRQPAKTADDGRADHALTQHRKQHQRPFMPSVSHLHTSFRVRQVTGGIATRPGIGVRFDNDTRPGKVRRRQRRYRGQLAVLSAQFGNWPEIQRPQRAGLDARSAFSPRRRARDSHRIWSYWPLSALYCGAPYGRSHMAVAAANAYLFVDHHKTVFALMHRAARADLGAGRIFTVVTGDGEVIEQTRSAARRRCPPASRRRHTHRSGGS